MTQDKKNKQGEGERKEERGRETKRVIVHKILMQVSGKVEMEQTTT